MYIRLFLPAAIFFTLSMQIIVKASDNRINEPIVSITLDDSAIEAYNNTFPVFKKYNIHATAYIITSNVGDKNHLNWDQIKELYDNGWDIGSHTKTHPYCNLINESELINQIGGSYYDLSYHGYFPTSIAYPYGAFDYESDKVAHWYFESARSAAQISSTIGTTKGISIDQLKGNEYLQNPLHSYTASYTMEDAYEKLYKTGIQLALKDRSWWILTFHYPNTNASEKLAKYLNDTRYLTDLKIMTVRDAYDYLHKDTEKVIYEGYAIPALEKYIYGNQSLLWLNNDPIENITINITGITVTNLISNPSFEYNLINWTYNSNSTNNNYSISKDAKNGNQSLSLGVVSGKNYVMTPYIKVENNSVYSISVFAKINTTSAYLHSYNDLVGYWEFENISSANHTSDSSGSNNDGRLMNLDTNFTTAGKFGQAFNFDGINDYIDIENSPSLNITGNQITLSAWIYPLLAGYGKGVIVKGDPYRMEYHNNHVFFWIHNGTAGKSITAGNLNLNQWNHIAAVYNGTHLLAYLNGLEVGTPVPQTGNITSTTSNLRIGRYVTYYFNGTIDEVMVYNRSLNSSEIADLALSIPNKFHIWFNAYNSTNGKVDGSSFYFYNLPNNWTSFRTFILTIHDTEKMKIAFECEYVNKPISCLIDSAMLYRAVAGEESEYTDTNISSINPSFLIAEDWYNYTGELTSNDIKIYNVNETWYSDKILDWFVNGSNTFKYTISGDRVWYIHNATVKVFNNTAILQTTTEHPIIHNRKPMILDLNGFDITLPKFIISNELIVKSNTDELVSFYPLLDSVNVTFLNFTSNYTIFNIDEIYEKTNHELIEIKQNNTVLLNSNLEQFLITKVSHWNYTEGDNFTRLYDIADNLIDDEIPIWISFNDNETIKVSSKLVQTINLSTIVLNVGSQKTITMIKYVSDSGKYSFDITNYTYDNKTGQIIIYDIIPVEPALSSNIITIEYSLSYCVPNITNTSWTNWQNETCSGSQMNESRFLTQYDSNACGEIGNQIIYEYQLVTNLVNTSWSDWLNLTCLANNTMNQTRNLTQYDVYGCGANQTFFEYQAVVSCDDSQPQTGGSSVIISSGWFFKNNSLKINTTNESSKLNESSKINATKTNETEKEKSHTNQNKSLPKNPTGLFTEVIALNVFLPLIVVLVIFLIGVFWIRKILKVKIHEKHE